jgi:hypothetical protein
MAVLAKLDGIVIRLLVDRTFGIHLHAFLGEAEMVMGLNPVRVIQGELPVEAKACALQWAHEHEQSVLANAHWGRFRLLPVRPR